MVMKISKFRRGAAIKQWGREPTHLKSTFLEILERYEAGGSTVRVSRAPTKRLNAAIALYMPQSVVTYGAQYTDNRSVQ